MADDIDALLGTQTPQPSGGGGAPLVQLDPDPGTGPTEEEIRDRYFAKMTPAQELQYGRGQATRHRASGEVHPFSRHRARSKHWEVVPVAELLIQEEKDKAKLAAQVAEGQEALIQARMEELRGMRDIDAEAQARLAAEAKGRKQRPKAEKAEKVDPPPAPPAPPPDDGVQGMLDQVGQ